MIELLTINWKQIYEIDNKWILILYDISKNHYVGLPVYNEEQENTYQGFVGRQTVFDYIKSIADEIDLDKSLILTETVQYKDAINIYDFMKECIISGSVQNDDGFDIDDYIINIEEEE